MEMIDNIVVVVLVLIASFATWYFMDIACKLLDGVD